MTAVLSTAIAVTLVACGSDDGGAGGPVNADVEAEGRDDLSFDKDSYTARAGDVAFALVNAGSTQHSLLVEGYEDDMRLVVDTRGDSDTGSLQLEQGDYVVYCDIAGHRAGGMEADLTIEAAEERPPPPGG
jgi:plastocyanin